MGFLTESTSTRSSTPPLQKDRFWIRFKKLLLTICSFLPSPFFFVFFFSSFCYWEGVGVCPSKSAPVSDYFQVWGKEGSFSSFSPPPLKTSWLRWNRFTQEINLLILIYSNILKHLIEKLSVVNIRKQFSEIHYSVNTFCFWSKQITICTSCFWNLEFCSATNQNRLSP